jgi:hypothetical protein
MRIDGEDLDRLAAELREIAPALPQRLDASPDDIEAGLARLVLTLVEFLRQVLEHQAVRGWKAALSDEEIETGRPGADATAGTARRDQGSSSASKAKT